MRVNAVVNGVVSADASPGSGPVSFHVYAKARFPPLIIITALYSVPGRPRLGYTIEYTFRRQMSFPLHGYRRNANYVKPPRNEAFASPFCNILQSSNASDTTLEFFIALPKITGVQLKTRFNKTLGGVLMSLKSQSRATFALVGAAFIAVSWVSADVVKSDAPVAPTNDAPNPYKTIRDWVQLPPGRHFGSSTAVTIDRDGKSIWYVERCGVNGCFDHTTNTMSQLDTVFKLDVNGKILKNWGGGMIVSVHGIFVDKDDNIWITDYEDNGPLPAGRGRGRGGKKGGDASARASAPPAPVAPVRPAGPIGPPPGSTKGHQVFKFNQDGKLLMTLGTPGGAAEPGYFYAPNAVILNKKGEIYVTEGHGRGNDRVLKFTNDGKLIEPGASWERDRASLTCRTAWRSIPKAGFTFATGTTIAFKCTIRTTITHHRIPSIQPPERNLH